MNPILTYYKFCNMVE